ncbi:MAG: putative electron transfer flavoprotein FixA [Raoultibacter sp.]
MKIVVSLKVVSDDQDIQVAGDGSLDFSKAHRVVSPYDLNAMEAAAQMAAAAAESCVIGMTVGAAAINDSKLKKNILARGIDELYMTADDACADLDSHATAEALAALVAQIGDFDVIVCGDGSADNYAQQVDVQLAAKLDLPIVTAVTKITLHDDFLEVERLLEDVVETVSVPMPAILTVSPDSAVPRIPGMKDILAAGKKPLKVVAAQDCFAATVETLSCTAPKQTDRKLKMFDASEDGALESFAAAIKAAL